MTGLKQYIGEWGVDSRIEHARTLPPEVFRHPAVLRTELQTVFTNRWLLLSPVYEQNGLSTPVSQFLAKHGGRLPLQSHGRPLYLEHQSSTNTTKAFSNVCTHAWYPLVREHSCKKNIQCEQHGRLYSADGKCLAQPGFNDLNGFPAAVDHLPEFPLHFWKQLPFISFGSSPSDWEQHFAAVDESICGLQLEDMQYHPQREEVREIQGNWKLHAWNFLDNFHIPYIHGGTDSLTTAMEYRTYQTEIHDHAVLQWVYAKNPQHGFHPDEISSRFRDPNDPDKRVLALWWFMFPNLTLNFYPWGLSINLYEPHPTLPDKTIFRWYHFVKDQYKYALRDPIWMNQKVDDEDVEALSLVRNNLHSPECRRGRFAPSREKASHWFHHRISQLLNASSQDR